MFKKLAHVRSLGYGLRTWDSPRYAFPGASMSHSVYDQPIPGSSPGVGYFTNYGAASPAFLGAGAGMFYPDDPDEPSEAGPSLTRNNRVGAQFSSLAMLPNFQSFANLHWSGNMGGMIARPDHTALHANYNPSQQGSKEQQRATVYNPWPSAGALFPKAV